MKKKTEFSQEFKSITHEKGHKKELAAYFFDIMSKIDRNLANESQNISPVWIWHLFQTASYFNDSAIKIEIIIDINSFQFNFSSRPFNLTDLMNFIDEIKKNNNKTNKPPNFSSSYILSKKATISGVFKEENVDFSQEFTLNMSREAKTIDEMLNCIEDSYKSISDIHNVKKSSNLKNIDKTIDCNIKFEYELNEKGVKIVEKGLESLFESLLIVMAFSRKISYVKIRDRRNNSMRTFFYRREIQIEDNMNIEIIDSFEGKNKELRVLVVGNDEVALAIELEEKKNRKNALKLKPKMTPSIFNTFPLLGSDIFEFPTYIHSNQFNINFIKDNLFLQHEPEAMKNKEILEKALKFYFRLQQYAKENILESHYLAISSLPSNIDISWFREKLQNPIRSELMKHELIESNTNLMISIQKVIIPLIRHEKTGVIDFIKTKKFSELCKIFHEENMILQKKEYIEFWVQTLDDNWKKDFKLNHIYLLDDLLQTISSFKSIHILKSRIGLKEEKILDYLKKLIDFLQKEFSREYMIKILNKFTILPNQNKDFRKYSELNKDNDIDEILKYLVDMTEPLLRIKDHLLCKEISFEFDNEQIWTSEHFVNKINKFIDKESTKKLELILQIIALIPISNENLKKSNNREYRLNFYNWAKQINKDIPMTMEVDIENEKLWSKSYKFFIENCIKLVNTYQNISDLETQLVLNEDQSIVWLNRLYSFLNFECNEAIFVPNQLKQFISHKTKPLLDLTNINEIEGIIDNNEKNDKENTNIDDNKPAFVLKAEKSINSELSKNIEIEHFFKKSEILKNILNLLIGDDIRKKLLFQPLNGKFIKSFPQYKLKNLCEDIDMNIENNRNNAQNHKNFVEAIKMIEKEIINSFTMDINMQYFPRFMKNRTSLIIDSYGDLDMKDEVYHIIVSGKTKMMAHLLEMDFNENDLKIVEEMKNDEELYGKIRKLIKK